PEPGLELPLRQRPAEICSRGANQLAAPALRRPHDLQVVDEEDGGLGNLQQLLDLRRLGALRLGYEPAEARLPHPMGLVADEDINAVLVRCRERIEVAKLSGAARTDHLAQVLREGLRPRG